MMRDLHIPWSDIQRLNYFEFAEYIKLLEEEAKTKKEEQEKQDAEYQKQMDKYNAPNYGANMPDMSNFGSGNFGNFNPSF